MRDRRQSEERRERRYDGEAIAADSRETEWYQFSVEIEALIASGKQRWAEELLRGIQQTVIGTTWVTQRQRDAVRRIQAATRPMHDWARRYPWPID